MKFLPDSPKATTDGDSRVPHVSRSLRNVGFHGNKSAHHGQGEGSIAKSDNNGPNSFVVWILTSKSFALYILQTLFVNPAPSETFRREGGGGCHSPGDPGHSRAIQSKVFFARPVSSPRDGLEVFSLAEIHRPVLVLARAAIRNFSQTRNSNEGR